MKAILATLTLLFLLSACASKRVQFQDRGEGVSSYRAVSRTFSSIDSAYEEIHGDCKKEWAAKYGSLGGSNTSFAVEILAIDKATSYLSALCVSTTYEAKKGAKKGLF